MMEMDSMMGWMMGLGLLGWVLVVALLIAILVVLIRIMNWGARAERPEKPGEMPR